MPSYYLLLLVLFLGCSNLNLKKNDTSRPLRLGVLGFKITAPIKKIKHIKSLEKGERAPDLGQELERREKDAKAFFIKYLNSYYPNIVTVDIPLEALEWKKDLRVPSDQLKKIKNTYDLDALILGEIPWYGKTNLVWPLIGFTADVATETLIIGLVTKWNGPIIFANLGWEVVTNGPLWFGGAWLFGQAYKPVTLKAKLIDLREGIQEHEEEFDVTKSKHMLNKLPESERKKIENQLDASLKKALKELAIELNND